MITLLTPAALLALTGLLVPVAIHLWNRRPGREVAVGSLRWLAAGANRHLRNPKPEQLWLLLLRATLLAMLAVTVAGPVWRQRQPAGRGVVLLSPEAARSPALVGLLPTIDSLRRKGYALRWLAAGFPPLPTATWRVLAAGHPNGAASSMAASQPVGVAWARVQQAAAAFPDQPLLVVTGAALRNFRGSHAALPAAVSWQTLPDTASASWLAAAALAGDSLRLLIGHSNETQTTFRPAKVLRPPDGQPVRVARLPPLRLQPNPGSGKGPALVPIAATPGAADGVGVGVEVAVVPLTIELYSTPEYATDARYLTAAVRAAAAGLAIAPILRRAHGRPTHLATGWTLWLSAEPLPQTWREDVRNGARLWREAAGPGRADTARLAAFAAEDAPVMVFRRGAGAAPKDALPVWTDSRGRPVLARQLLGAGAVYQLNTRLNPAWSELADDPALPARLLLLLHPEPTANDGAAPTQFARVETTPDHRALDPAQLVTAGSPTALPAIPGPRRAAARTFRTTNLRPWLALAAGLLLLMERLLARRRETPASTSTTP